MALFKLCMSTNTMTYAANNNNERKTKTNRFSVRSKLMMIRLTEYENITALVNAINDLCSLYATLTDHTKSIDDEEKLVALTHALPSSYGSTVELIFNIDYISFIAVPKVLDREQKLQASSSSDVALFTPGKGGKNRIKNKCKKYENPYKFCKCKKCGTCNSVRNVSKSCPNCRHCKRTPVKCICKAQAAIGQPQVQVTGQPISSDAQATDSGFMYMLDGN
eukprot:Pgem_evm1s16928